MGTDEAEIQEPSTLAPGVTVRYLPDGKDYVIRERKDDDSGWWLEGDAGGIDDRVWKATDNWRAVWPVDEDDEIASIGFDPDGLDPADIPDMIQLMHDSNETRVAALEQASGPNGAGSLENAFDALRMVVFLEQIAAKLEISEVANLDFEGRRANLLTKIEAKYEEMMRAREAAERQARLAGGPLQGPRPMPRA